MLYKIESSIAMLATDLDLVYFVIDNGVLYSARARITMMRSIVSKLTVSKKA